METESDDFEMKYDEIIENLYSLFKNDINKKQSSKIIRIVKNIPSLTIFEAFNLIYREVQIMKTISKYKDNTDENMIIFENKKDKYEPEEFNKIIEKYKVKSDEKEVEEFMRPINECDERRKIKINKSSNIFNYLPIKPENIFLEKDMNDLYSKNENEYLYHPLYYKTIMCHFCNNKHKINNLLCPYSHDIQKDFRIIYDYQNEDICKFLNFLHSNNLLSFQNYLNYLSFDPLNFDPNMFKVFQCSLKNCSKVQDKHLCPFYHKTKEKRRPSLLFRYNIDDKCFDKEKSEYKVDQCPFGIFCSSIHSQNEYQYHPENFRKSFQCTRQKVNGHCIFLKTCYGIHPDEEYEKYKEDLKKDDSENIISENEELSKLREKINTINKVSDYLKCRKCNKIPNNAKIIYLCGCNHYICKNCYDQMKEDGEWNEICPICDNKIQKGDKVKLNFNKKQN